jgi:hypothetical protein
MVQVSFCLRFVIANPQLIVFPMKSEKFQQRMALGETQAKLHQNADAKLNEQIALRVKQRTEKAQKEAQEGLALKKKRQDEMKNSYHQFVRFYFSDGGFKVGLMSIKIYIASPNGRKKSYSKRAGSKRAERIPSH